MAGKLFNVRMTFKNKGNGMSLPITIGKLLDMGRMRNAAISSAAKELEAVMKLVRDGTDRKVSSIRRALTGKYSQSSLSEAYKEALAASYVRKSGLGASMGILDASILDAMLPNHADKDKGYGGWWRLFEVGTFGKVNSFYGDSRYTFVPIEGAGRHGEGIMMKRDNPHTPPKLARRGHPGIRPFRIVGTMQLNMASIFNSQKMGLNILDNMFVNIARGVR